MQPLQRKPNPNFTTFLQQPFVQQIAKIKKWTISDINKMPVDLYELKYKLRIKGCDMSKPYSTESLHEMYKDFPDAKNFAFYLNGALHDIVILDIEPICPPDIKANLMNMPCLYAEKSMSGKGVHMIFPYPEDILMRYPNAAKNAIKYKKYYEILINHCVTFTGDEIPHKKITDKADEEPFRTTFENLAKVQKETIALDIAVDLEKIKPINCKSANDIMMYLSNYASDNKLLNVYVQHHMDLGDAIDWSSFEYGYMAHLNDHLKSILKVSYINDEMKERNGMTTEERLWFITTVAKEHLPERDKHNEKRNGMPWLVYIATKVINDDIKKEQDADCN